MYLSNRQSAFTLIELLIVMLLLSISIGIVIPLSVNQVESSKVRAERAKVIMLVQHLQSESFFKAKEIKVLAKDNSLVVGEKDKQEEVKFSFLNFVEKEFLLTSLQSGLIELTVQHNAEDWVLVIGNDIPFWKHDSD
ncbi:type II secretion system protein [Rheinheimera baltica]|uniref:type II secretion system protein n=1 Tax=Rheinheimera baltica TaxID=67576 RepID=UPI00273E1C96|nr:type II secretion system protein [Rheinheimera baltica]MDP5149821.1 type II secretion system protein [Rheinheimera baltica]